MRDTLPRAAKRKRDSEGPSQPSTNTSLSQTTDALQNLRLPQISQVPVPPARYPDPFLLTDNGQYRLKIGVDFDTPILKYVEKIRNIHAQNEQIRFPTVIAIQPTNGRGNHATIVFANDATKALAVGNITCDHLIRYPKLALVNDIKSVCVEDQPVLISIKERHQKTLKIAGTFDKLTVVYPGGNEEAIRLKSMNDVIVACLKYFLTLVKQTLRHQLGVSEEELAQIFERNTEIGFAAPAFWTDSMLDEFLHLIQAAGWPTHCRIWSEPKCALAAHLSSKLAALDPTMRTGLLKKMNRAMIICDVGSGTTDLATLKPRDLQESSIKFESLTEGEGSLCGGRLLDLNIEQQMRRKLGNNLSDVRTRVSNNADNPIGEDDFFEGFDFGEGRSNFDATKDIYQIRYSGNNLPSGSYNYMTPSAMALSKSQMVAAHESHARRVIRHIEAQLCMTRKELEERNEDLDIEILLIGGVTRAAFLSSAVERAFNGRRKVTVGGSVEAHDKPLVAMGCILCLSEPNIGKRFVVKQAYGIPINKEFDPAKHSLENQSREDERRKGIEARNLMDWIVSVGTKLEEDSPPRTAVFDWEVKVCGENGAPRTDNPRNDPTVYPLAIKPRIFRTTNAELSSNDDLEFKRYPEEIKQLATLGISLSKEECLEISRAGKKIGWYRDPATKHWLFWVQVRVVLEWHDVRVSCRAEIPRTGSFIEGEEVEVWSKEVKFATIEHHGHSLGDEQDEEEDRASSEGRN